MQWVNSLLIASEANPTEILAATLKYIQGGAPIVVFSSYIEVLIRRDLWFLSFL